MKFISWLRRWTPVLGMAGVLGASLSGCGGSGSPIVQPTPDPGNNTRAACTANTHANGRARWTVLVYMNAANNLQPDSLLNIAQMMNVGSDTNLNLVVQWKQANVAGLNPPFVGTRRYFIRPHTAAEVNEVCDPSISRTDNCKGNTTVLDADRLPDPTTNVGGTSDMGDWRTLQNFVQWGATTYPADHLAVVIWNHGSGWRSTRAAGNRLKPIFRAVSQDDQSRNEIKTWEIPQGLAGTAQPIDLLVFDASLMQMAEVAYEVRNSAKVMVGSEDSPPGAGYPYHLWLADLKAGGANPCTVGESIVTRHVSYYTTTRPQDDQGNVINSMIDLSRMETVGQKLQAFATALRGIQTGANAATLANAREVAQNYAYADNKDLFNYTQLIQTGFSQSNVRTTATDLQTALTGTGGAVMFTRRGSSGQSNSNGLAIYIPRAADYLTDYANLALIRQYPAWAQFLQAQTQ